MYVLQWKNKFSGQEGFVESVSAKDKHFVNTFDKANAKQYANKGVAGRMIKNLTTYGEADNNIFTIVEA